MKQILILIMLLISFGNVSGQEEEFKSKYFPDLQTNDLSQSFADSDLDCSVLEEQIKSSLFLMENHLFLLNTLSEKSSELLSRRMDGNLSSDEIIALSNEKGF